MCGWTSFTKGAPRPPIGRPQSQPFRSSGLLRSCLFGGILKRAFFTAGTYFKHFDLTIPNTVHWVKCHACKDIHDIRPSITKSSEHLQWAKASLRGCSCGFAVVTPCNCYILKYSHCTNVLRASCPVQLYTYLSCNATPRLRGAFIARFIR